MNEALVTNSHGLRLLTQFEGTPRLTARLCEGGRWELGYGCTFHPDGRPVEEGETCTEDYVMVLFRHALEHFEDVVRRLVTVELNENQFSGLTPLAYNIGEENFASSTVLRETNARRFDDAAAAFGMWVFATKNGWKQALRGLLRRQYASACLFMGYDWVEATADEAIALQRIKPDGDPPKGSDRVTYKTPFLEVLRVAQHYPLHESRGLASAIQPVPAITQPSAVETAPATTQDAGTLILTKDMQEQTAAPVASPEAKGTAPPPATQPEAARVPQSDLARASPVAEELNTAAPQASVATAPPPVPKPAAPPKPPPIIAPQPINPHALPTNADTSKNMADSTRMTGMILVGIGTVVQVVTLRLGIGTAIGAVFFDLTRDPVVITLVVTAIVGGLGWVTKRNGKKTFSKGADDAKGALH